MVMVNALGSPPHMRGTVVSSDSSRGKIGITPAHAGNSGCLYGKFNLPKDHPRTCGEQIFRATEMQLQKGSPPHMRGTDIPPELSSMAYRITPAHAGNSNPREEDNET